MKKIAFIFSALFIAVAIFTSCGQPATPSSITADCIEYVKAGDYEAYVNTYNATDEEKAQLKELFEQKGNAMIEENGGIESYEITEEQISEDGQKATVKFSITYGNGEVKKSNKFHFEKVDDEWKQVAKK